MGLPYALIAASLNASMSVGCANTVLPMSSHDAPYCMANTPVEIISPACCAMMWMPKISSVCLSLKNFTNPSLLSTAVALLLALNGNTPLFYSMPFSFSTRSFWPTLATSGEV